jgi:hypothetical protein
MSSLSHGYKSLGEKLARNGEKSVCLRSWHWRQYSSIKQVIWERFRLNVVKAVTQRTMQIAKERNPKATESIDTPKLEMPGALQEQREDQCGFAYISFLHFYVVSNRMGSRNLCSFGLLDSNFHCDFILWIYCSHSPYKFLNNYGSTHNILNGYSMLLYNQWHTGDSSH